MDTKICSCPDCPYQGQPQPIENFYQNSYGKDGYHSTCKECKNRHVRARYHQSPEVRAQIAQRTKEYTHTERGKLVRKKADQNQKQKNLDKVKARQAVKGKIENNKRGNGLPPPNILFCVYCGKQANQYHHHNGYDKEYWLDVVPVCSACHYSLHQKSH